MKQIDDRAESDGLYPLLQPFHSESLQVSPLHNVYFEQSGNASGFPVLFLHGGPGSQARPEHRRYFDPDFYHAVLFDQRGCGRSTPAGCTDENTTWNLVEDMEALRVRLGVEKWLLFGGSWGSTLALAYASRHPQQIAGMVLRGVFLASDVELEWYLNGLLHFIPEARVFLGDGSAAEIIERYHRAVSHCDQSVAAEAAGRWATYEQNAMAIGAAEKPAGQTTNGAAALASVRVQLHYLAAGCFLATGELMQSAARLMCPTIIVQGRSDMVCPPVTAYELSKALPDVQLRIIEQGGHSASGEKLAAALRVAADDMRDLLRAAK